MTRDEKLLGHTRTVSLASEFHNAHVGCVIASRGKVIASGCNGYKTHALQDKYNAYRFPSDINAIPSVHAETAALLRFLHCKSAKNVDAKDCIVYVYREWRNGQIALARPCKSCMKMLKDAGFRTIVYSTFDGYAREKISLE